ncbi:MAG TPA: cupredoxin domain-containing protein [Chloroflexota bacterium]|jgi:plastocyanin
MPSEARRVCVRRVGGIIVALVVLGIIGSSACGGDEESPEVQGPTAASATPESAPSTAESLLVELDDYIEPKVIEGRVGETLAVTAFSEGQQTHTLTIDALGVDREFPPSDTQEFSLTLKKAGEFKVYCRFHRDKGMMATLRVSE